MKISLNTIKGLNQRYHTTGDITAIGVDQLIDKIGAQLGAIETIDYLGKIYQNILIVKVVKVQPHPEADNLKICLVDDNQTNAQVERSADGLVQIVCGAPNVVEGMMAVWLAPGVTVPVTAKTEPLALEAKDIRGVISNGMLASAKELGIGDNHDGILEMDESQTPGADFAEVCGFKDEVILDIENKMFTHRPDCFGFLGVARELAGIQGMSFKSPDWYSLKPTLPKIEAETLAFSVVNELPDLVPRFCAIALAGVKIGPSPLWLQVYLAEIGQNSINNLVDYSNFFMQETAQPIHIYDYNKLQALSGSAEPVITIRNPKPGEQIDLLNGKQITPRAKAMMVATGDQLICVGGIMGGSQAEVDEQTKNIVIEVASWDMYEIRRTMMEHGLFTDAATRFTKGQSPLQNLSVLAKIVDEICRYAGGKVASELIDDNHLDESVRVRGSLHPSVSLTPDFINARLGLKLTSNEMKVLLENVEFNVEVKGDELNIKAPFWRTDIEIREDVVEEVGRLYGYDKLPLELPHRSLMPAPKDPLMVAKEQIRHILSSSGANELLTYSFVDGELIDKVGQDKTKAYELANALRPELQYYRLSLMPSLLEKVHPNLKAGYDQFVLYELGKSHSVEARGKDDLPEATELTALVVAAADKLKLAGSAYYQAQLYLRALCPKGLELKPLSELDQKTELAGPYQPNRSASVYLGEQPIGIIGEFKPSVTRALKLPGFSAGFEIKTEAIVESVLNGASYTSLSRFPKVSQDLSLKVATDTNYSDLFDLVWQQVNKLKPDQTVAELSPLDIYIPEQAESAKHITLRLKLASYQRTLTDNEVNQLLEAVAKVAKDKLGADRL